MPSRSCCRILGHCGRSHSGNFASVMPSGPGAPRLARTWCQARCMLAVSTTASIRASGNRLKAGFSLDAAAVRPGRDSGPAVGARLHLVLCQSERSFGILTSLRLPVSYTGLSPDKITPMPGVPPSVHRSRDCSLSGVTSRSSQPNGSVLCARYSILYQSCFLDPCLLPSPLAMNRRQAPNSMFRRSPVGKSGLN